MLPPIPPPLYVIMNVDHFDKNKYQENTIHTANFNRDQSIKGIGPMVLGDYWGYVRNFVAISAMFNPSSLGLVNGQTHQIINFAN